MSEFSFELRVFVIPIYEMPRRGNMLGSCIFSKFGSETLIWEYSAYRRQLKPLERTI